MKKIMIAIVAVALTAVVNASTVSWGASAVQPDPISNAFTAYVAYIIDNAAYAQSLVTKDTYKDAISAASYSQNLVKTSATANTGKINGTIRFDDGYAAGDSATYYMVILNDSLENASWMQVSNTKTGTVTSAGALSMMMGSQASNTWVEIVPEPTSGLLILLGMAGLALRRKQA